MFIPSTFKRPVSSWKALNLRKTLLMASSEIGRAVQQECRDRARMPSLTYSLSLHDALPIYRSRARRCVEACVYGTLDFVGYPRFPAPVEFIAAVIAYYVHPVNIQTACLIMEGAEFTENIINGVERPVKAAELFAFTLRVR